MFLPRSSSGPYLSSMNLDLDLGMHYHQQVRLTGNFGLNGIYSHLLILAELFVSSAKLKMRT